MSKEEAKTQIAQALGLPASVDPTNYDPLAAAASGDADSTKVLLETARLAKRNEPSRRLCEVSQNTLHLARSSRHGLHCRIGRTARSLERRRPQSA